MVWSPHKGSSLRENRILLSLESYYGAGSYVFAYAGTYDGAAVAGKLVAVDRRRAKGDLRRKYPRATIAKGDS